MGSQVKHTMRLPENLKEILKSLNKAKEAGEEEVKNLVDEEEKRDVFQLNDDDEEEEEDLHSLPAGVWPKQGLRPGVIGTLLYYISLALTFIGLFVLLICAYLQPAWWTTWKGKSNLEIWHHGTRFSKC